jgi:hypothetical protein
VTILPGYASDFHLAYAHPSWASQQICRRTRRLSGREYTCHHHAAQAETHCTLHALTLREATQLASDNVCTYRHRKCGQARWPPRLRPVAPPRKMQQHLPLPFRTPSPGSRPHVSSQPAPPQPCGAGRAQAFMCVCMCVCTFVCRCAYIRHIDHCVEWVDVRVRTQTKTQRQRQRQRQRQTRT